MSDATLYVDYIYLDTDERRRFAQVSHEYLKIGYKNDKFISLREFKNFLKQHYQIAGNSL
jgi:hypothetical protein